MKKILRRRVSTWSLLSAFAVIGLLAVGMLALSKPLPEYLVATSNLAPGIRISPSEFETRKLDLGVAGSGYLTLNSLKQELYLNEFVAEGEFVLLRHLTDSQTQNQTTVVLLPSLAVSPSIRPGSWVQIWRTVDGPSGFISERLVERCQVVAILANDSLVSDAGSHVEVSVTEQESALILQTISLEQNIYVLVAP
jgi:hypothetical protein